ncbi:MAG: DegV family protein [Gammaproteobacteria bacterium]
MKVGVVIDASCDLPRSYVEEHELEILPGYLEFGGKELVDIRDPRDTLSYYRRYIADKSLEARSRALPVEQITKLFLEDLVLRYDRVLVLCVSASRGRVFSNATEASYGILQGYRDRRAAAGITEPFALRVLDTKSVGPGEGIITHEAVRMIQEESPPFEKLRRAVKDLTQRSVTYLVPNDLYYLRHRASTKGETSMGVTAYHLGRALDLKPIIEMRRGKSRVVTAVRRFERAVTETLERARESIRFGRSAPVIVMSFGGDPRIIRELAAYQDFEGFAATHRVQLHLSVMSATLAVNVGPGAFSLALIDSYDDS